MKQPDNARKLVGGKRLLIFTEGTILMHRAALTRDGRVLMRKKIIDQVKKKHPSVHEFDSYVPIKNAPKILQQIRKEHFTIMYLTSRRKLSEIKMIRFVLKKYGFPPGRVYFRNERETYATVISRVMPNILVDDTCESVGVSHRVASGLSRKLKRKILLLTVPEFGGIEQLKKVILRSQHRSAPVGK